jgi:hypothetical protein
MRARDEKPKDEPQPVDDQPSIATADKDEAKQEKGGPRPVIRYFRSCTAYIPEQEGTIERDVSRVRDFGGGGTSNVPTEPRAHLSKRCTWQSGRWPKERKAEIEYQEHALKAHSEPGQKRVVVKREEVDV